MKPINLALGPLKVANVTQATVGFEGNKGTGKTNSLKMSCYTLAEAYKKLGIVIFDPLDTIRVDCFNRIRVTRKTAANGCDMAALLNKGPHERVIISFADLLQAEQNQFMNDLFANWRAHDCVIAIDELHDFCPQAGQHYADEVERAIRHWRNRNVGFMFTTQRPAKLNKNVQELADVAVIYRMVGNNDRAAVERYMAGLLPDDEVQKIMADIRTLPFLNGYLLNFRGA